MQTKNSLIFIQWSVSDACMFNVYQADNLKKYKQKEDDLVDNCSITPQDLQTKIPNKFALKVDIEKHIEWNKNNFAQIEILPLRKNLLKSPKLINNLICFYKWGNPGWYKLM